MNNALYREGLSGASETVATKPTFELALGEPDIE